jgi:tetratricopeptide (TPR) repeat protein
MDGLARAYREAGHLDNALPLHQQAVAGLSAVLGPDHLETLSMMSNLAETYRAADRLPDAQRLVEETLGRYKAKLSVDHPDVVDTIGMLARIYQAAGRVAEALPLLEETLRQYTARFGAYHPNTLSAMIDLARAYLGDRPAQAEKLMRECLAIREKNSPDDWLTFETRNLLGACLLGQKKYRMAETLLIDGYEGLKAREARIPAPARKRVADAALRIVALYNSWSKPDKAAEWKARLCLRDFPGDVFAQP